MSDPSELVKSEAVGKMADLVSKLAGPMAEEFGLYLGDKMKVFRLRNWISVVTKTEKILADAKLPANAVPPRMFLPIVEASSVEDDDNLQLLWAGLLASASNEADRISPSFVETLKQLTPGEAKVLGHLFDSAPANNGGLSVPNGDDGIPLVSNEVEQTTEKDAMETFERLGLFRRSYDLEPRQVSFYEQMRNKFNRREDDWVRGAMLGLQAPERSNLPQLTYKLDFTEFGIRFMQACMGPKDNQTGKPSE